MENVKKKKEEIISLSLSGFFEYCDQQCSEKGLMNNVTTYHQVISSFQAFLKLLMVERKKEKGILLYFAKLMVTFPVVMALLIAQHPGIGNFTDLSSLHEVGGGYFSIRFLLSGCAVFPCCCCKDFFGLFNGNISSSHGTALCSTLWDWQFQWLLFFA